MSKMLFSTLLIFFYCQIFAQNKPAEEKIAGGTFTKPLNKSLHSESILKLNIFSPLLGYSQFSFERPIANRRSLEFGLGIIGAGRNLNIQPHTFSLAFEPLHPVNHRPGRKNQFGSFFEFGYKIIQPFNSCTLSQNNFNSMHALEGSYIKPSFIFGAYSFNQFRDDSTLATVRRHHSFGALMVNFGHQWEFDSKIVFELYAGMGGEIDNVRDGDDLYGHPFVLIIAKDNPSVNFAFAAGFRLGFLLK
jgi:hypothetical protein